MSALDRPTGGMVGNVKELGRRIKNHNVTVSSAGIAFYGLLALVPTMIALVSLYGIVADPDDVEQQVSDLSGSLDEATRDFLVQTLRDVIGSQDNGNTGGLVGRWAALIAGIAVALFSASGAVQKLIGTIGVAYETEEKRPGWKVRLMSYGFTAGAIVGVALMILSIGVVPAALDRVDLAGGAKTAINILQLPILALLFAGALTVLYRYGPDRTTKTPWKNPGAIVATLLFIFFAIAFSIYSANVGMMPASYGLLGSIAALMIFLQLTAVAVIVGAEVNGAVEVGETVSAPVRTGRAAGAPVVPSSGEVPDQRRQTLSFGKAMAGLVALFALGKGLSKD